jgi:hypothetical protein
MSAEPINLFSRTIDPAGVLAFLRSLAPGLKVVGPDDNWERIEIVTGKGLLRKGRMLALLHDAKYYGGPDWPRQQLGMQGYFSRFPESPRKADVLRLIGTFRFALATEFTPDRDEDDDRLALLMAVAQYLDGAIFTPSALHDAAGRVLLAADGEIDDDAVLPAMPPASEMDSALDGEEGDNCVDERAPPLPERVACRALALAAVTGRALLEQEDPADPQWEENRRRILDWLEAVGIRDELEPEEWKVLQRPVGKLAMQDAINATWRFEGLAVLAWALKRCALPPQDELVDPWTLLDSLGFLDADSARDLLADPPLRSPEEFERMDALLFALHWRLRDFSLRPEATDFAKVGDNAWMGHEGIAQLRLIEGDLAIGDRAIADAPADDVQRTHSAAQERHLAINWLRGWSPIYSETDTST